MTISFPNPPDMLSLPPLPFIVSSLPSPNNSSSPDCRLLQPYHFQPWIISSPSPPIRTSSPVLPLIVSCHIRYQSDIIDIITIYCIIMVTSPNNSSSPASVYRIIAIPTIEVYHCQVRLRLLSFPDPPIDDIKSGDALEISFTASDINCISNYFLSILVIELFVTPFHQLVKY